MMGAAERLEFFSGSSFSYGLLTIDGAAESPSADLWLLDEKNGSFHKTRIEALPASG